MRSVVVCQPEVRGKPQRPRTMLVSYEYSISHYLHTIGELTLMFTSNRFVDIGAPNIVED